MKNIKKLSLIFFAVTGLTSCIEEDPIFNPDDSPNIVEIKNTGVAPTSDADAIYQVYTSSFDIQPEGEVPVVISYSGAGVAPQDITVNLAIDEMAISKYNEWWNKDDDPEDLHDDEEQYVLMPSELYTLTTTSVTIPKGQREATLIIKVKPNQFDFEKKYGLGLKITSSSYGTISGNNNTVVLNIGAKNEWHGTYSNTFSRTRITNGTTVVSGSNEDELTTTGPNSVVGHLIGYYSNLQTLTIDPATNKVTVTSPGIAITEDVSYYDPATRTFYIQYVALNTIMKSTLVRKD